MLDFFEEKIPLEKTFASLAWTTPFWNSIYFCSEVSGINFFLDPQKRWGDKRIFLGKTGCFEYNFEAIGPQFNPEASINLTYNFIKDESKCETIVFLNTQDPNYPVENRDIKLKHILS